MRPLTRLRVAVGLATALAATLVILQVGAAGADGVRARSAESFVESIGVNVHLGYDDSAYNHFARIRAALDRLGVRHIRDMVAPGRPEVYERLRVLAAEGIKLDAIAGSPLGRYGSGTAGQEAAVIARRLGPGVVASIEGPNEFDDQSIPHWAPILRRYQRQLWDAVRSHPSLDSVPVLAPSLVTDEHGLLGNVDDWSDEGNVHTYPAGQEPDAEGFVGDQLAFAAANTGSRPVQATETGYTNALRGTVGQLPTSERAAGIYMPRLFLDDFRRGVTRTYAYELIDPFRDPSLRHDWLHFGLLRHDFAPKPAFSATRNLIALLEDPGGEFGTDSLSYSVDGGSPSLRQLLLEKRDGSFWLALWDTSSVWNPERREAVAAKESTVTLRFEESPGSVAVYRPNSGLRPLSAYFRPASLGVGVGPRVTLVQIDPEGH